MKTAKETTEEATTLIRAEKERLATLHAASESLTRVAHNLEKVQNFANQAGEILIGNEIAAIEENIGNIAGKLWDARKHKTHAELDEMMRREVNATKQ